MKSENGKTILLAEDQFLIAMSEKSGLEKYGYAVIVANSGKKAIELAASEPTIGLILMDISLGDGIDGIQASESILREHDLPIIFLSSHADAAMVEKAERISSYGYLVKNTGLPILNATIKTAFRLFEANQRTKAINEKLAAVFDAVPGLREADEKAASIAKRYETALAASEMRYRRLFESAKDGILILDADTGRIVDANPFLVEMLGYSKEQFIEKAIWEIGAFKDVVANKENFLELQVKQYIRYEDLPLETATGETVAVEFISNVYLVNGKKVIQCNIRNITDRKIAEELINTLLAEKELILKEVHHRIKDNMYVIATVFSLQAEAMYIPEAKTALKDAQNRVQSMIMLYNKLYQSFGFKSVSVLEYLPPLIREILANFPNAASIRVAQIIDDFSLDTKMLQPLGIIINELLTNIMKYAFSGMVRGVITVSALLRGKTVLLCIEDNGHGMPAAVDFATSPGLGLALVNLLTKQLKGTIRIEREHGTKISLEFQV